MLASQVCATAYHLDQSGNDSTGDGSLSTPWRTIRYALDELSAGDMLYIHVGTYPAGGDSTAAYTIPTSGSSGNEITITSYENDQVVISTAICTVNIQTVPQGVTQGTAAARIPWRIGKPAQKWVIGAKAGASCADVFTKRRTVLSGREGQYTH